MEDKTLSEHESMLLIQQMIHTAKQEQKDDGKGWIIWGWMLFTTSLLTFLNLQAHWTSAFFFWNLFGLASMLLLLFQVVRHFFGGHAVRVTTYTQDLLKKLNIGFFLFIVLIVLAMNIAQLQPKVGFALLLGLYGFWALIYGSVLSFKPSVVGACFTYAFAVASLFVSTFASTMLLHAAAVLCSYIIPGHMAHTAFKNLKIR